MEKNKISPPKKISIRLFFGQMQLKKTGCLLLLFFFLKTPSIEAKKGKKTTIAQKKACKKAEKRYLFEWNVVVFLSALVCMRFGIKEPEIIKIYLFYLLSYGLIASATFLLARYTSLNALIAGKNPKNEELTKAMGQVAINLFGSYILFYLFLRLPKKPPNYSFLQQFKGFVLLFLGQDILTFLIYEFIYSPYFLPVRKMRQNLGAFKGFATFYHHPSEVLLGATLPLFLGFFFLNFSKKMIVQALFLHLLHQILKSSIQKKKENKKMIVYYNVTHYLSGWFSKKRSRERTNIPPMPAWIWGIQWAAALFVLLSAARKDPNLPFPF